MATETIAQKRTIKLKLPTQSREVSYEEKECRQQSLDRTWFLCSMLEDSSYVSLDSNKRGRPTSEQFQPEKKLKMDRNMTQQCSTIVKSLIRQPEGWVFKDPVDPVKLGIPDYFSIIKKPMDLSTIKSKLDSNVYNNVEEFVADVHLIFANATLYNPPSNSVHQMARKLNDVFDSRCRLLIDLSQKTQYKNSRAKLQTVEAEQANTLEQSVPKTPVHRSVGFKKFSKLSKPKVVKRSKTSETNFFGLNFKKENPVEEIRCDPSISCGLDSKTKCDANPKASKLDHDSDESALDEEVVCRGPEGTVIADPSTTGGFKSPSCEALLSPSKALRAAMVRQRFADTILKAQHKTLHEHSDAGDPAKIRLEKERLEKKQREERARIEAQLKAAEAASRKKEDIELKNNREQEREKARVALQEMRKTAGIEVNTEALKELEMLSGGVLVYSPRGEARYELECSLEKLGLFIKDDECVDDEADSEGEEGEILH